MFANIDLYILAFSAVTVLVTIWMGFRSAKKSKTASDFFVAGRSVGVGMNASAISGEYLSAASFMGIAGMVMSSGYDALWYPVCYACGYLFLLLFIAGPLRRFGAYTIPDFAEGRFDSPVFRKIAVVFVLFIGFFYTMPQMKGAGTTLAYIFPGLPYWAGVVLVGAVITLNVALGGMKGITLVQAFQYWAKMFAISVPIFVLMAVYGHYGKQVGRNGLPPPAPQISGLEETWINSFQGQTNLAFSSAQELKDAARAWNASPRNKQTIFITGMSNGRLPVSNVVRRLSTLRSDQLTVNELRSAYAHATGREILYVQPSNDFLPLSFDTVALTEDNFLPRAEEAFRGGNFEIHSLNTTQSFFFHQGQFDKVSALIATKHVLATITNVPTVFGRQTLPPKAPADATWLNPFGPLTTKAAKNAAAAIGRRATNVVGRAVPSAPGRGVNSETMGAVPTRRGEDTTPYPLIPLRTGLSPDQRMTVVLDSLTVAQALGIYAELTGRQLLPKTNSLAKRADDLLGGKLSQLKLVTRPRAPDNGMREHGDGAFTAAEVKSTIEKHCLTNGIVLQSVGTTGFRAISIPLTAPSALLPPTLELLPATRDEVGEKSAKVASAGTEVGQQSLKVGAESAKVSLRGTQVGDQSAEVEVAGTKVSGESAKVTLAGTIVGLQRTEVGGQSSIQQGAGPELKGVSIGSASASSAEKEWLAKHEKPLALLYTYSLIIAIVCGTAGLPHILVRFYTNPDGVAAKKTTMWVMILIGVFYVFPPVFGVIGRNLLPELYNGVGAKGTDKIVLELPRILNAKYPPLGSILSGITCAGAFAAFMSTFSGLLVSMTGALAHDVYGRILRPKSTPEQRMRMFKIGAIIIGGIAVLLGSFVEPLEINFMVGQAFAIAAASYFPLLFMAVWWRKLTMKGAAIGMLTGGVCALVAAALTNFSNLASDKGPMGKIFSGFAPLNDFWAEHPLLRILCEQPAIWAVPLAIALMIVVSKLTAKTIPADSRMKMLVLHAPEQLGLKQEYIQEHAPH